MIDLKPMPISKGPPLPEFLGFYWPWYRGGIAVVTPPGPEPQPIPGPWPVPIVPGPGPEPLPTPVPVGTSLSGTVSDSTGNPLGQATVSIDIYHTVTGSDGHYEIDNIVLINPPYYEVDATKDGYTLSSKEVSMAAGANSLDFVLHALKPGTAPPPPPEPSAALVFGMPLVEVVPIGANAYANVTVTVANNSANPIKTKAQCHYSGPTGDGVRHFASPDFDGLWYYADVILVPGQSMTLFSPSTFQQPGFGSGGLVNAPNEYYGHNLYWFEDLLGDKSPKQSS